MKKFTTILATLMLLLSLALVGCKKAPIIVKESDDYVVITATSVEENTTLAEYMQQSNSDMFVIENGMVVSINGLSNAQDWSACWMLYTDDEALSDTAYSIEYKGKIYGSSLYGAESLTVKSGKTYIWIYQTF